MALSDTMNLPPSPALTLGVQFPDNFQTIASDIFRRLFRVYAHIYTTHFSAIVSLGEEAHLNTSFKHFILFVKEFNLIEQKELAPLADLIESLLAQVKS
jgi:MOB kinase activator 1